MHPNGWNQTGHEGANGRLLHFEGFAVKSDWINTHVHNFTGFATDTNGNCQHRQSAQVLVRT